MKIVKNYLRTIENLHFALCNNVSKPSRNGNFLPYLRGEIGQANDKLEIVMLKDYFFYIYVMASSFFYIYIDIYIDIDIYITFTNLQSVQSFYLTPFYSLLYLTPLRLSSLFQLRT